jgi:hypothetical protein
MRFFRRSRRSRGRWLLIGALFVGVAAVLLTQASGNMGAAMADKLRATIGASRTAQVESVYLEASDTWQRLLFNAGVTQVHAPWKVPATSRTVPVRRVASRILPVVVRPYPSSHVQPKPTPRPTEVLHRLQPLISPALPGEGIWTASVAPASPRDAVPLIAKAYFRPDPARPYAIATILRFDLRYVALHMVAGTSEPGGAVGMLGTGSIPAVDQRPGMLLAAFNGGFKYADGAYGMMVDRTIYVRPVAGAATIAITSRGRVFMGVWGQDARLSVSNPKLVSWRQNGSLLIDHGVINPLVANDGAWGTTVLNHVNTWRSAIGIAPHHVLLYASGNALSVSTLARALQKAGATRAMEMDINPYWVRAFFYGRDPAGHLAMASLRPDMQGNGLDFLGPYARDFFYITRIPGRSKP